VEYGDGEIAEGLKGDDETSQADIVSLKKVEKRMRLSGSYYIGSPPNDHSP